MANPVKKINYKIIGASLIGLVLVGAALYCYLLTLMIY